jgi:hypothetical protein
LSKRGSPGANKLTAALAGMIDKKGDKPLVLDFGIILGDYSLKTNTFPIPIPQSDYSVCRAITYDPGVPLTQTYCDGAHGHPAAGFAGSHVHNVRLPEKMYWIRPGDKVLVAWVQDEACVVDIVYRGDIVG